MFSGNEWLIVVLVALVVFGGTQLPKIARNLGSAQKEFKKGMAEGADEDSDESDATTEKKSA